MTPFKADYFIGYVNHVSPQYIKIHFPSSTLLSKQIINGEEFYGGLIGNFITIEGENNGFIGKLTEIDLSEKERLSLNDKAFQSADFHPTAKAEILLAFDYFESAKARRSINTFPNIGAKVYVCPREFIQRYVMQFGTQSKDDIVIDFGKLTSNGKTDVKISQQSLFGRHCAVVGTTGGGKSWTVSKLLEGMCKNHTKAIIIDPTGEYQQLSQNKNALTFAFGKDLFFSYKDLTIEDLFFLVKPAERIQAPKLLEAIRSLKCVALGINQEKDISGNVVNGTLKKQDLNIREYERFCYSHKIELAKRNLAFDITNLSRQLICECVFPTSKEKDKLGCYGGPNENDVSSCISLATRIDNIIQTDILDSMFSFRSTPEQEQNLKDVINSFVESNQKEHFLLRIGFEEIGFESQAREIAANAIAKYLLNLARNNQFKEQPIVLFLDEAHQFLNKSVVDNYFASSSLSAFDQIAKECRKYGLFLCLATQMPRDIPIGTLSQIGTFIIHRLINYNDKEAIKQACSSADADTLSYLPVLGAGEAILSGVDFPMPLSVKINAPIVPPNSQTPVFRNML